MSAPRCGCPDPGVGAEQHCLLLRDFPGGFYGDAEAARDDYCECICHEPDPDDDGGPEMAERERLDSEHAGERCGPDCGYCGRCS